MRNVMKIAMSLAVLPLYYLNGFAQPVIDWSVTARQTDTASYSVTFRGELPDGWHIYGENRDVEGLDAPVVSFSYENVQTTSNASFSGTPAFISDKVFERTTVVYQGSFEIAVDVVINGVIPPDLKGSVTVYAGQGSEFYPIEYQFTTHLKVGVSLVDVGSIKRESIKIDSPISECGGQAENETSLLGIFLLGLAGGLIALLTPCVFPMIPVTVSYFGIRSPTRKDAVRNAVIYGSFIFMIYVLLSLPFHLLGDVDPEIFNIISTNSWLNLAFFVIFMFFAASFFGFFVISLPGNMANKTDAKSDLGNLAGIFFMALTLAIVSFSCTGPILGSLLVGSLGKGAWPLTAGLAGFGLALGLPYGVCAAFPSLLKSLPKSGGWLDTVKKVLAFIEVALAFKFLSNADLVMHWGLLPREVFLSIWIVTALCLAAFLLGILRLPHDVKGQAISPGRKIAAVVSIVFAGYLFAGVLPHAGSGSLQLLSGFPPPTSYSWYKTSNHHRNELTPDVINDYQRAVVLSDSLHKPILIDFTGWACVNCRKMEENVWSQPNVSDYIKEHYVLVSLYVDDREKLPIEHRITYKRKDQSKKEIETHGDKWATFEAENFGQVSQPLYAIVDDNERLINNPVGYTPDASKYLQWLQCGKETFDNTRNKLTYEINK